MKSLSLPLKFSLVLLVVGMSLSIFRCQPSSTHTLVENSKAITLSPTEFHDKMKGAWAGQVIGVTYGFPVEFKFNSQLIPDSIQLAWHDSLILQTYRDAAGAYDDIYVDLSFLNTYKRNRNATAKDYALGFSTASFDLWFANQVARNNIRNGINPPAAGHWLTNPECTSIDFQIEADFIGLLYPGQADKALALADSIGHIMAYGDGYYGGVFISQMYAEAFVNNDIKEIIQKGLAPIPREVLFHKMITDVVNFHTSNPNDWKACWKFINDKYQDENGSPFGVNDPWNIEASMNSCHVVTGLLYGNDDFEQSIEIATRCGNDADCNPATVAGILGTIHGYHWIPESYTTPLSKVKDMKFLSTDYTLDDAIETTEALALELLDTSNALISIIKTDAPMCALEIARPNHHVKERTNYDKVTNLFKEELNVPFTGNGIVLFGKISDIRTQSDYQFETDSTSVDVFIDGEFQKNIIYPVSFENRKFITYYNFELTEGEHRVELKCTEPLTNYSFDMWMHVVYTSQQLEAPLAVTVK